MVTDGNKIENQQLMTESKLQSDCFQHVWNTYPATRRRFRAVYNNPKNAAHGAILKGMGLLPGISDQVLLTPPVPGQSRGSVTWIECKLPDKSQSPEQKDFQALVESLGMRYYIYHSLPELLEILRQEGAI